MRVRPLITALGLNAIPALGWYVGDWSAGTTLALYWFETLLGTLLVALRIVVHRRVRPSRGHFDYLAPQKQPQQNGHPESYLFSFLVPALAFTFAHGIFLAAFGGMMIAKNISPEARVDVQSLLLGLAGLGLFQVADLLFDLIWIRTRPFIWIEHLGSQTLGRVFVIHITIIGGMAAVMYTGAGRHFFGIFIFLKTLLNCSAYFPQWHGTGPPALLARVMDRIPSPTKKYKNVSFSQFWKQEDDQEKARVVRNEKPVVRSGGSDRGGHGKSSAHAGKRHHS